MLLPAVRLWSEDTTAVREQKRFSPITHNPQQWTSGRALTPGWSDSHSAGDRVSRGERGHEALLFFSPDLWLTSPPPFLKRKWQKAQREENRCASHDACCLLRQGHGWRGRHWWKSAQTKGAFTLELSFQTRVCLTSEFGFTWLVWQKLGTMLRALGCAVWTLQSVWERPHWKTGQNNKLAKKA